MKFENNFCTPQQGKKLTELGITEKPSFYHRKYAYSARAKRYGGNRPAPKSDEVFSDISQNEDTHTANYTIKELAPAFTASELMIMLPPYEEVHRADALECYWYCGQPHDDEKQSDFEMEGKTMAQVLANRLIHLLKNNVTTAQGCNERLKNA